MIPGLLLEAGFLALAMLGDLRHHLPLLFTIYAAQFGLMIWIWRRGGKIPIGWIWFFAVLFRLTLLPTTPSLSDDIYRYNWEGRVQRAGWSPYEYPPSAPELAYLRDSTYPLINHNAVPTIYPPLTQMAFRMGTYLSSPIWGQKIMFFGFDVLAMVVLLALLRQRGVADQNFILYAWNPLVVIEFAGSGHNDSLGILYLLIGLLYWDRGKSIWATLGFAASFLAKYFSILLLPYFAWKKKWKELGIWALFVAAGLAPFCFCWMMVHGTAQYAAHWQFNGSLFVILDKFSAKPQFAKWAAAALLGALAVRLGKTQKDLLHLSNYLVAAALLLAPTVHPWYFIWLIPFLCLMPNPAFLVWNLTIILAYTVWPRYWSTGNWNLLPVVQGLEYLPVYGIYIYSRL